MVAKASGSIANALQPECSAGDPAKLVSRLSAVFRISSTATHAYHVRFAAGASDHEKRPCRRLGPVPSGSGLSRFGATDHSIDHTFVQKAFVARE